MLSLTNDLSKSFRLKSARNTAREERNTHVVPFLLRRVSRLVFWGVVVAARRGGVLLEEEEKIKKNTNELFKDLSRRGEKEGQRRGKEEERFKQKSFRERSATKRTTTTKERDFETKNAFEKRIGRKRDDD